jgi:AcrR family transcriptional regulator
VIPLTAAYGGDTMATARRQRANGVASRHKIIEAALEIASERGYEGTSISAVSERSGLPPSSIYWHFRNKDELIAAVIDHSFEQWRGLIPIPQDDVEVDVDRDEALITSMRRAGRAIADANDFLRLGLMLALERRPEEAAARSRFLEIRQATRDELEAYHRRLFGDDLDRRGIGMMGRLAMAAADGLFVASEIDDDEVDIEAAMELMGVALAAVADRLRSADRPRRSR